jgi:hypothetical protein
MSRNHQQDTTIHRNLGIDGTVLKLESDGAIFASFQDESLFEQFVTTSCSFLVTVAVTVAVTT